MKRTGDHGDGAAGLSRWRIGLIVLVVAGTVYGTAYLALRARHVLLCTGWYHNVKVNGRPAPEAGWRDLKIRVVRGGRVVRGTLLGVAFWPLIQVETRLVDAFGREPGE